MAYFPRVLPAPTLGWKIAVLFPFIPPFFGRSKSKNNDIFRKWGIKKRTNEEMRADYVKRAGDIVEGKLGLKLPDYDLNSI